MKKTYEMVFIVKTIEKKQFEVAIQKIENIITDNGDDIKVTERWGKKHITCQINGFNCSDTVIDGNNKATVWNFANNFFGNTITFRHLLRESECKVP